MTRHFLLASLIGVVACSAPSVSIDHPTFARGSVAVASPEPLAEAVAMDILSAGGNAADAAVALAFALAVTFPEAGNIGGGGFILIRHKDEHVLIDCREVAPRKASRGMYLDEKGNVVPDLSTVGMLAVGVPGEVMGLWIAHKQFGSLPWADLLKPAVKLAREGFPASRGLEMSVRSHVRSLKGRTNFAKYFGDVKTGAIFRQPELAETLERIATRGADGFYGGKTAELVAQAMKARGGLIDEKDLSSYEARIRTPLHARIPELGIDVVTTPPPSSGGIALIQMLRMAGQWKADLLKAGRGSSQYIHLVAEIEKRVFADRAHFLGDTDFVRVPIQTLISPEYCKGRAALVDPVKISPTEQVKPGPAESPETTHFSVLDAQGNAVSHTTTLNGSFGSCEVVDGAGFLLNNEMDDFSAKPGVPNIYGVVGADANAIQPGKRMLSSMCPTMVYAADRELITGTPGGPTIFTSVFQITMNVYLFGLSLEEATDAPRFHHQLLPKDQIDMELNAQSAQEVSQELKARGYTISARQGIGDVHSILVKADPRAPDLMFYAKSDSRGSGKAEVKRVKRE